MVEVEHQRLKFLAEVFERIDLALWVDTLSRLEAVLLEKFKVVEVGKVDPGQLRKDRKLRVFGNEGLVDIARPVKLLLEMVQKLRGEVRERSEGQGAVQDEFRGVVHVVLVVVFERERL